MNISEIDSYVNSIKNAKNAEEQIRITKEFSEQFFSELFKEESYVDVKVFRDENTSKILKYLFRSGAYGRMLDIGLDKIPRLACNCRRLVTNLPYITDGEIDEHFKEVEIENLAKRYVNAIKQILGSEEQKDIEYEFFDDIVAGYMRLCQLRSKWNKELGMEALELLGKKMPVDKAIVDSKTFSLLECEKNQQKKQRWLDRVVKAVGRPKEYYQDKLKIENKRSVNIEYIDDYDKMLYEYILAYGSDAGQKDKIKEFFDLCAYVTSGGSLNTLKSYQYAMQYADSQDILAELIDTNRDYICKDLFARLHEQDSEKQCSDEELSIFKSFYDDVELSNEPQKLWYGVYEKDGKKYTEGTLKLYMQNVWPDPKLYSCAQYIIRTRNSLGEIQRPEGNLGKVYDYIKSVDPVDLLKLNFEKNINADNVEGIDMALCLICEADYTRALQILKDYQIGGKLKSNGINMYNLKFMDVLLQKYVENCEQR